MPKVKYLCDECDSIHDTEAAADDCCTLPEHWQGGAKMTAEQYARETYDSVYDRAAFIHGTKWAARQPATYTRPECDSIHDTEAAADDCCTLPEYRQGGSEALPHAGQGGLRGHSIGELYPWTIAGRGRDVEWQPVNLLTGQQGPRYVAYENAEAWIAVHGKQGG